MSNLSVAFFLTLFAGLATGIGSAMVLLTKQTNKKFLSFSLGLSAGVMLYVSLVEILSKSVSSLSLVFGEKFGNIYAVLGFFSGIAIIILIDKFIPKNEHTSELYGLENSNKTNVSDKKAALMRMGLFTALAISIHNFPEGLATFISALDDPELGFPIATAIAIHNIPEGIAVAVPIFYATGSKMKAFKLSFLSGLTEPLGAVIGYFLFVRFMGDEAFGFIFASVAGIMVYISLAELLPTANKYAKQSISIAGLVFGMMIMAISLILFI